MNEQEKNVPAVVVKRLPRYYRYLGDLLEQNITKISSGALSKKMNVTASQIRQDFNCFGGFGQQGYGYNVEYLYHAIGDILGLHDEDTTIIIGAGNLGRALANHTHFAKRGFKLVGIFDVDTKIIGSRINGIEVMSAEKLEEFLAENRVDIAMLTLPGKAVKETAELLAKCGIKGLLNFSYTELKLAENVAVENVHMSDSLMTLSYKIKQGKEKSI